MPSFIVTYHSQAIEADDADEAIAIEGNGGGHWQAIPITTSHMSAADLSAALDEAYGAYSAADADVQRFAIDYAKALARETWPEAHHLTLDTSDQSYDYGFVLADVVNSAGESLIDEDADHESVPEDLWRPLSDLNWNNKSLNDKFSNRGGQGFLLMLKED